MLSTLSICFIENINKQHLYNCWHLLLEKQEWHAQEPKTTCAKLLDHLLTNWLPIWMIHMDVIRSMCCVHQHHPIWSIIFVSLFNCPCIPIRPINSVFKNGNSKRVRQCPVIHCVAMVALQIRVPGVRGSKCHSLKITPLF